MTSQPREPGQGHFRVSDSERDGTLDVLAEAATDGRLTLDEYSDRADRALVSVTRDDLAVLTRDLAGPAPSVGAGSFVAGETPRPERLVAIFGSEHRRGRWPVPARLEAKAVFGECKIELQDATLHSRVTVLEVKAMFGSIEVLVPEGVQVRMSGSSIFGQRTCHIEQDTPLGAPVIEVRGKAVFGEITVRHPGSKDGGRREIGRRSGS